MRVISLQNKQKPMVQRANSMKFKSYINYSEAKLEESKSMTKTRQKPKINVRMNLDSVSHKFVEKCECN